MARNLLIMSFVGMMMGSMLHGQEPTVSYYKDIRPIIQQHCQGCHQPARDYGGYIMTSYRQLFQAGDSGKPGITAGKPQESYLLDEIRVVEGKAEMPKRGEALTARQYQLFEAWIKQGARDDTPPSAQEKLVDEDHPPVYQSSPVITSLAYSPEGKYLAVTGYHEILIYGENGKLLKRLIGLSERIQSMAFSRDGTMLAVSGGDPGRFGEIQIWEMPRGKLRLSIPTTFDTVYGISWNHDNTVVAVGGADNTVRAFSVSSGKQVVQMGTHSDWVLDTTFSRDGKYLVSVSRDMSMKLTEVTTQRFIDNVTSITPGALKGGLMTVDIRPVTTQKLQKVPPDIKGAEPKNYDELLVAGADGKPRLYKMHRESKRVIGDDANKIREYPTMTGRISDVKFNAPGNLFVAASSLDGRGEVAFFETDSGKKLASCEQIQSPIYAVAWKPDGSAVASAGFAGVVYIHDTKGKLLSKFQVLPR